jgi:hypothetical protein
LRHALFPKPSKDADFRLTRARPPGNAGAENLEISAECGINCRSPRPGPNTEITHFVEFFTLAHGLLLNMASRAGAAQLESSAMLPALGAVSAALGVLKSLTTNASSSEPIGFSPAPANASGNSVPPAADATTASGVGSSAPISTENISALLKAQAQSLESDANSLLQDVSTTVSKDASVAYNAINQLLQRQTTTFQVPRGTLSINV